MIRIRTRLFGVQFHPEVDESDIHTWIEAKFALLAGEALLFAMLICMMPLWLVASPKLAWSYLLMDQILCLAVACGVAMSQRRIDVIAYAPLFILPRVMNALMFFNTLIQIVVLRRNAADWFSPPRLSLTFVPHLDTHGGWFRCLNWFARSWDSCSSSAPLCLCRTRRGRRARARAPATEEHVVSNTSFPGSAWVNTG